jgi:hypothetical protein
MKRHSFLSIALIVLTALVLPYVLAALLAGRDHLSTGFLLNPLDGASYLAKMYQGWAGSWRFRLPYTAEAQESAFIFVYYLFLGHLARWLGIPLIWTFHLARLLGAGLLLLALAQFCEQIFRGRPELARLGFGLAALGSGMGWLVVFFGPLPSDFWVAEAYPFLSMFTNPHFPLGLALVVWAFALILNQDARFRCLKLALLGLLISAILQFGLVVGLAVTVAYLAWTWVETRRLEWQPAACLGALGGPFLLYQYAAILGDPILAGWNGQNQTPSPAAWDFLLSFSPALPLAAWGAAQLLRQKENPARRLLAAWLVLGPLLVSVPFSLQRRFMFGYSLPCALLAVFGAADLAGRWPAWRRRIPALLLTLALPTNLLLILTGLVGAAGHAPALYLTRDEARGLAWIRSETAEQAVVLASPEIGSFVPAFTGRRVLYGHPFETLDAPKAEAQVIYFFQGQGWDGSKESYLTDEAVDFVFYGPREQALGGRLDLARLPLVFEAGQVRIFAVERVP